MPRFALEPFHGDPFDEPNAHRHVATVRSPVPAALVWARLHDDRALHWCRGIRTVTWTSPRPHGVGATREVVLATGARVSERYIQWDEGEEGFRNAFVVDSANVPLFRRFAERYTVIPAGTGSIFTWEFMIEPKVPGALGRIARHAVARDVARMERDTTAYLAGRP